MRVAETQTEATEKGASEKNLANLHTELQSDFDDFKRFIHSNQWKRTVGKFPEGFISVMWKIKCKYLVSKNNKGNRLYFRLYL